MDLRHFLGVLRSRWQFIFGTLAVGIIATIAIVLQLNPVYSSTARVFVSTPTTGQADSLSASFFTTQRVASYAALASDPTVLQSVIDELELDTVPAELAGQITTTAVPQTLILEVEAKGQSPQLAQQIAAAQANAIIELVERIETPDDGGASAAIVARIAGKASYNANPVSPNVKLDLAIGLLLSLFVGIAGAIVRDLLDTTVKSREDIEEATGNAVMGTLPYEPSVRNEPLTSENTRTSLSEAFRVLRTNLQFANLDASRQTILVSSALPDEGKTLVASNLAISLARSGRSVLLIDADMRNPNVADLLGLENSVGIMSVLIGRTTIEQATQEHSSGVRFLGTGPKPPNPAEVLDTQSMRQLLHDVRSEYDTVIIDAPPLLPVADTSILVTEVDGTLLLARYGSTGREQLRLAAERIDVVGGRLFGTILNRTPWRSKFGYGENYGYGYGTTPAIEEIRATEKSSNDVLSHAGRRSKR